MAVLGLVAVGAMSSTAAAQLTVPTLPPVHTVVPTVITSPTAVVPTAVPTLAAPSAGPTLPVPTVVPTPLPTLSVPTVVPTVVPSVSVPSSLPTLPVPTAVPTAVPITGPSLPVILPTMLPTVLPKAVPALPVPLPSVPVTLPSALPALPELPVGVPLPALPGLDGALGLPAGAVRVPTVAGVSEVYLDLDADGLADARIAENGTVSRVTPSQAAAVDRATGGAGTEAAKAARALAARPGGRPLSGATGTAAIDAVPASSDSGRSPSVLLFAGLLALAVAVTHLHEARKAR